MGYKEKPNIKLYRQENDAFVLYAIIDDYQDISWEYNVYEAGTFTITINYNIPNARLFARGLFVQIGQDKYAFGEIETISDSIGSDGKGSQIRQITGYDARHILRRRIIKQFNYNGAWQEVDKGELCIRNLIADQCGVNAELKRRLPINNTIPQESDAIGKVYSVNEQYSNLYEVCKTIATQSEIGWRIKFENEELTLECYNGTNRQNTVFFATDFDSLKDGSFTDSQDNYANVVYVAGKGQNSEQDLFEGGISDAEGLLLFAQPDHKLMVNATDNFVIGHKIIGGLDRFENYENQSEMTTEEQYRNVAYSKLVQYAQTVEISGTGLAKSPYEFKKQYNVGDWITVSFSNHSSKVQILSVTEHWAWNQYDLSFSFGKPQATLSDQLQILLRKVYQSSNKTNSTDSVRWYTIPQDTEMPADDVKYNTIGFMGDVSSDETFKLYLDNEKTGAKSYHVYIKQLGGNNKLKLTTGRTGATELELDAGTYVTLVYVDEDGNVYKAI